MAIISPDSEWYFGAEDTKPYVPTDFRSILTHVAQNPGTKSNQAWIKAAEAYKAAVAAAAADKGGTGGGGYGGYASGGGGGGDPKKPYLNYYTRYLNIGANMGLVNKAAKGNYTMTEFALLVQREDTSRFIRTWKGQEVVSNWRTMWARIFPSLGREPGIKSLRLFLKQEPAGKMREVTNPASMRDMYKFVSKTKLFKKVYPEFEHTHFAQSLNFTGYRREKDAFKNVLRSYTGKLAEDNEVSYFFRSRIGSNEFEKNLQTMLTGGEAYQYATGAPVEATAAKKAIYGRTGSAQTLAKVAAAYQQRETFQKSREAGFGTRMDEKTGRITTQLAY